MTVQFIDEVNEYIETHFTEEFSSSLRAAMFVFEAFDFNKIYGDLADVLYDFEADQTDFTNQKFVACFNSNLDDILTHHHVSLNKETCITKKTIIIGVLYRLQYLEDPEPVLKVLETFQSDEEKFSLIIEMFSDLSQVEVLEAVESVDPISLTTLAEYLYKQEELLEKVSDVEISTETQTSLYENLKAFFSLSGQTNLASNMAANGIVPGFALSLYLPFVLEGVRGDDVKQTALNTLSLFYYSQDTFKDPLKALHEHMEDLGFFGDTGIAIEREFQELINQMNGYRKANDVARAVSSTSHQG